MSYMDFSSWPRDQEQQFVVFEQRTSESSKKAMTLGIIVSAIFLVIGVGIYVGVPPDSRDLGKDMNMSNLSKKSARSEPAPAPKTEAPKAEAPKAEAPTPAAAPAAAPAA